MSDKPEAFDLCILGCGSGGFAAAIRALDLGKKVCLIERGQIGGAGVMWGALASKTFWELAKDYAIAAKKDRGYRATGLEVDFNKVKATVIEAVKEKQYQMHSQIKDFSPGRWQGPGALIYKEGDGSFISQNRILITLKNGGKDEIFAHNVLIATGSSPRKIPGIDIDLENRSLSPDEKGELTTDHHCRVQPNIYAAGDVTQYPDLVNIAEREGRYAVKHMFGIPYHHVHCISDGSGPAHPKRAENRSSPSHHV